MLYKLIKAFELVNWISDFGQLEIYITILFKTLKYSQLSISDIWQMALTKATLHFIYLFYTTVG